MVTSEKTNKKPSWGLNFCKKYNVYVKELLQLVETYKSFVAYTFYVILINIGIAFQLKSSLNI